MKDNKIVKANKPECLGCMGNFKGQCIVPHVCIRAEPAVVGA